ncbi:hypothetical protein SCD_n00742 [Sulfuricella denitrificans skB26]|uniref:SHOCT domain-containing protein n=1 Tax=Sulfuricella denitrificans (strain DSM 22764 / NBRC 105220 / skB26) TaxID=1163617 RepID=S6AJ53_SULDS|nr:SHOCT domain-containing protein [Sulfuricella denitrificans]BAN34584.1 hypothetical protein SCD_n00742 [Sulfuricella denitrificans skB26]
MRQIAALLFSIAALSGCANPGIVKLSPDTYMLSREAHGGIFASPSALKAGVISDAHAFAEGQGKVAIPISAKERPMGNGPAQWASFEYQFRVVDKNDPEVRRTSLLPPANVLIQKIENISPDIRTKDESIRPVDVYAELVKLDDLRKKGIINEIEFEAQKKKILSTK